jgi:hypothetical protein
LGGSLGRGGSGLGYSGLPGSGLVVEFDTRVDLEERDPDANHVSVHFHSDQPRTSAPANAASSPAEQMHSAISGPFSAFESNDAHIASLSTDKMPLRRAREYTSRRKRLLVSTKAVLVQIAYTPSLRSLKVFIQDQVVPVLVVNDAPVLTGQFWAGFTASTSHTSRDTHDICQWYFEKQTPTPSNQRHAGSVGSSKKSASSAAASSSSRPDGSSPMQEACDLGFSGPMCTLDLSRLAGDCLYATRAGCSGCLAHPSGHCIWCASQQRCVSNDVTTRVDDASQHKPYCSDPASIVEEAESVAAARVLAGA